VYAVLYDILAYTMWIKTASYLVSWEKKTVDFFLKSTVFSKSYFLYKSRKDGATYQVWFPNDRYFQIPTRACSCHTPNTPKTILYVRQFQQQNKQGTNARVLWTHVSQINCSPNKKRQQLMNTANNLHGFQRRMEMITSRHIHPVWHFKGVSSEITCAALAACIFSLIRRHVVTLAPALRSR
jgi:hypothetical protein